MKLNVHEIGAGAMRLLYEESTEALNAVLVHGGVCDFEFHVPAAVQLEYYRAGEELFFQGHIAGTVVGHCARCLDTYDFQIDKGFSIALVPRGDLRADEVELEKEELDFSVYEGEIVDLTPLVREQIILALPLRPLCRDTCRGLCSHCGANLNAEPCGCPAQAADPRLAVLSTLKVGH